MKAHKPFTFMKTRITRLSRIASFLTILAVSFLVASHAFAAKPPGGSSTPSGTIYFWSPPYQGDGCSTA
jgi:hypothetical protein